MYKYFLFFNSGLFWDVYRYLGRTYRFLGRVLLITYMLNVDAQKWSQWKWPNRFKRGFWPKVLSNLKTDEWTFFKGQRVIDCINIILILVVTSKNRRVSLFIRILTQIRWPQCVLLMVLIGYIGGVFQRNRAKRFRPYQN